MELKRGSQCYSIDRRVNKRTISRRNPRFYCTFIISIDLQIHKKGGKNTRYGLGSQSSWDIGFGVGFKYCRIGV